MARLRNVYIGAVFAALFAPLLCVTGLRGIVHVAGFERKAPRPKASAKAFLAGTLQNDLKAYYDRKYFGRGELLMFKHLVFDAVNLGQYHAGYSGNVIQGREGFLYERGYLDVLFNPPTKYHTPAHHRAFGEIDVAPAQLGEAATGSDGIHPTVQCSRRLAAIIVDTLARMRDEPVVAATERDGRNHCYGGIGR